MVRHNARKSVEELYASKIENSISKNMKSQVNTHRNGAGNLKGQRTERDYGGFLISSNTPYNATSVNGKPGAPVVDGPICGNLNSMNMMTSRRKSARPMGTGGTLSTAKGEKYYGKEEKILNLDDVKQDHSSGKAKTTRPSSMTEKSRYNNSNMYDNKLYAASAGEGGHKGGHHHNQHHHHQQHNHHSHHRSQPHNCRDDDKDDDTEEFFELIRLTVEKAIGKSISDLLNRNFRELANKVDRFSTELKSTNSLLNKLQSEMNNKVVHYGEENSRHFRYLCMKSEYDKMFYQHQTMMATNPAPVIPMPTGEKNGRSKTSSSGNGMDNGDKNGCGCHHKSANKGSETNKSSSNEQIVTPQSSEAGMREIIEHIQRFCSQAQMSGAGAGGEMKCDERMKNYRILEENLKKTPIYDEEDDDDEEDDYQMSSDGMTPRSDDQERMPGKKYSTHAIGGAIGGNNNMRSCATSRGGNGGGDA